MVLLVTLPSGPRQMDLLRDFRAERGWQRHYAVVSAFGAHNKKGRFFEVDVLDSEVEGFGDAQASAIDQAGDEIGGVAGQVGHGGKQGADFGDGGGVPQVNWTGGAQGVHRLEGLFQGMLIEIEYGVKGLVLGAGGDIVDGGEVGEKALDFFLAGEVWRHALDRVAVALEPIDVHGFSPKGHVLATHHLAESADGSV